MKKKRNPEFLVYRFGDAPEGSIQIVMKYTGISNNEDFDYVDTVYGNYGNYSNYGSTYSFCEDYVLQKTGCNTIEAFHEKYPEYSI